MIAEFSGDDRDSIPTVYSTGNTLLMRFVTDEEISYPGWTVSWGSMKIFSFFYKYKFFYIMYYFLY